MTLTEFLADSPVLTPADVSIWTQRGVDLKADAFPATAILTRTSQLRKWLAAYCKTNTLPMDATITLSREKIADFGVGELLTLSTGERFAAVASKFRIAHGDTFEVGVIQHPTKPAPAPKAEPASETQTETPVAEAAVPKKQKKAKRAKKATAPKAEDITDTSV